MYIIILHPSTTLYNYIGIATFLFEFFLNYFQTKFSYYFIIYI
nr:MAG TPA: hypothetical protein [Caudoviricetes sp.]